jgi:hypothetical protein
MFVGCDSKDYFYFHRHTSWQRATAKDKSCVSLPFKNMVKPLRRAVCNGSMLLKIRGTGHMDRHPNYSGQAIQTDSVAGHGESIARSEQDSLAALLNGQILSNAAHKLGHSVLHRQHTAYEQQVSRLHRRHVRAQRLRSRRQ